MTTETMTIHKGLAELKILDERIKKEIKSGLYCAANKHSNEKINGVPIDDFKKAVQGTYDKVTDLINRRKAIKKAVVLSNAKTTVKIADVEYTVAEAIEMKNHGIEFETMLINTMDTQYKQAQAEVNRQNGKDLEERADQYEQLFTARKTERQQHQTSRKYERIF